MVKKPPHKILSKFCFKPGLTGVLWLTQPTFYFHTWPVAGAMQAVKMDGKERAKWGTPQPGLLLALDLRNQLVLDTERNGDYILDMLFL